MGKYGTVRQATEDNVKCRMNIECWITKATATHPEYVILIVFQLESASMLCLSIHCLSCFVTVLRMKILKITDIKANRNENLQNNSVKMKRLIMQHKRIIKSFILKGSVAGLVHPRIRDTR